MLRTVMADKKFHFIYKTVCTVTSKFYIGMHSTDNLHDDYLGSGKRLSRSIEKHGVAAHIRQVIEMCDSREALREREKQIITEELLNDPLCMNMRTGGDGGATRTGRRHSKHVREKISHSLMGHRHSDETRAKIGEMSKGRGKGKPMSEEQKAKLRGPSKAKSEGQLRRWARVREVPDENLKFFCDDMRHLVCTPYSVVNLHAMAEVLGIGRHWFHGGSRHPHYDIPKRRIEEVSAKCTVVTPREILRITKGEGQ